MNAALLTALKYESYEAYLDSLVADENLRCLRDLSVARLLAYQRFRIAGSPMSETEFLETKERAQKTITNVRSVPLPISSRLFKIHHGVLQEMLRLREGSNLNKTIATLIHMRIYLRSGILLIGLIDFQHRLVTSDLTSFFLGKAPLRPLPTDLFYYNVTHRLMFNNRTPQFEVLRGLEPKDAVQSNLVIRHRGDLLTIYTSPRYHIVGRNTCKSIISERQNETVYIYDHSVRRNLTE